MKIYAKGTSTFLRLLNPVRNTAGVGSWVTVLASKIGTMFIELLTGKNEEKIMKYYIKIKFIFLKELIRQECFI